MESIKFDKTAQLLAKPGVLENITQEELSDRLTLAAKSLEQPIKRFTPVGSGNLQRSIIGELVNPLLARVMTPVKYGVFIEKGTQAHPVNSEGIASLTLWARRKFGLDYKAARGAAFAIAANIRKKGSKGHKMFEKGFEFGLPTVMNILNGTGNGVIERLKKL